MDHSTVIRNILAKAGFGPLAANIDRLRDNSVQIIPASPTTHNLNSMRDALIKGGYKATVHAFHITAWRE